MYKEKIQNIIDAIAKNPSTDIAEKQFKFLIKNLNAFSDYVKKVVSLEYEMPIIRARYSDDIKEMQEKIMEADKSRRFVHEVAVMAVNSINRLSKQLGIEDFLSAEIKDNQGNSVIYSSEHEFDAENYDCREFVAGVCKDFTDELWFEGRYKQHNLDITEDRQVSAAYTGINHENIHKLIEPDVPEMTEAADVLNGESSISNDESDIADQTPSKDDDFER